MKSSKIGLISGGFSHEANLSSAPWITSALSECGVTVVDISYHDPDFFDRLREANVDLVFPQTLGAYGEDGVLQGILDILDIPYVGSGVSASALCSNKFICSEFIKGLAVSHGYSHFSAPITYPIWGYDSSQYDALAASLGSPFLVKPMLCGASFGVEVMHSQEQFHRNIPGLLAEYQWLVAQSFVHGKEYCWGLIEDDTQTISLPAEFLRDNTGMTIHSQAEKVFSHFSIPQTEEQKREARRLGDVCFYISQQMGIRGLVRMDVIVDKNGCAFILDVNSLPGLVPEMSMLPFMCEKAGINYTTLITMLVASAKRPQPMQMRKLSKPPPAPNTLQRAINAVRTV